jgi:hypothetical protein
MNMKKSLLIAGALVAGALLAFAAPVKVEIDVADGAGEFVYQPSAGAPSLPSFVLEALILPGPAATTTIYTINQVVSPLTNAVGALTNTVGTKILASGDRRFTPGTNQVRLFRGDALALGVNTNFAGKAFALGREE